MMYCSPTLSQNSERSVPFAEEALPHLDALYRYAWHLTAGAPDAARLTEEAFLRAYRLYRDFGMEGVASDQRQVSTKAWLFQLLRRLFLGERSRRGHPSDGSDSVTAGLPDLSREVILLTQVGELSDADAAAVIGGSAQTVRTIRRQAQGLLQEIAAGLDRHPAGAVQQRLHEN